MTRSEARRILQERVCGRMEPETTRCAEAKAMLRQDRELENWWESQQLFEERMRESLRSIRPPEELRGRLVRRRVVLKFPRGKLVALAALLCLSAAALLFWLKPTPPDRFADFRQRMVAGVLRSYHMEVKTNDETKVRAYMSRAGSPSDYAIPAALAQFKLAGGGRLQWRGHPVSMICFEHDDDQMLFLFVIRREALSDVPSFATEVAQVNKLTAAAWSDAAYVYLLAGPPDVVLMHRTM